MIEAQKHGSTCGYVNQLFLMNFFLFIAQFWPQIKWSDPDGHLLHGVLLCPLLCKLVVFLTETKLNNAHGSSSESANIISPVESSIFYLPDLSPI